MTNEDNLTKVTLSDYVEHKNPPQFLDPKTMTEAAKPSESDTKKFHDAAKSSGVVCVILAAGQGSRFVSSTPKVIHPFSAEGYDAQPLASYSMRAAIKCGMPIIVVVGHERKLVVSTLSSLIDADYPVLYVVQNQQMGTGHAVYLAKRALPTGFGGNVIVTYADNPGVDSVLLGQLSAEFVELEKKHDGNCGALILTGARADAGIGAASYGRIVRKTKSGGAVVDIVEKKTIVKLREDGLGKSYGEITWSAEELDKIDEFNSGIVIARAKDYFEVLGKMVASQTKFNPPKYEYYATDFVKGLVNMGIISEGWKIPKDAIWKLEGANTVEELGELEQKNAARAKTQS